MKTLNFKATLYTAGALLVLTALPLAASDFLSEEAFYTEELSTGPEVNDPLESINRVTFKFNDFLYINVVDPISKGYQAITPDPVEKGAKNFFRNIRYPIRLAGNLLQGRVNGAWVETGRFAINTTVGIAGVFTPADQVKGFEPIPSEEIGQALGAWGMTEGFYLVIPGLGPSNARDLLGLVADSAAHPIREPFSLIEDWDWEWQTAIGGTEFLVGSPSLMDRYRSMKGSSIDPYSAVKNAYSQSRRAAIVE